MGGDQNKFLWQTCGGLFCIGIRQYINTAQGGIYPPYPPRNYAPALVIMHAYKIICVYILLNVTCKNMTVIYYAY